MNKTYLILITVFFSSCLKSPDERIFGDWKVANNYYTADYKIERTERGITAKVMYYDDGTTILKATHSDQDIYIPSLHYKDGEYVDAVSGATQQTPSIRIKIRNTDSLDVTKYVMHKPIKEYWTRKID